jgi:TPR repeat protein
MDSHFSIGHSFNYSPAPGSEASKSGEGTQFVAGTKEFFESELKRDPRLLSWRTEDAFRLRTLGTLPDSWAPIFETSASCDTALGVFCYIKGKMYLDRDPNVGRNITKQKKFDSMACHFFTLSAKEGNIEALEALQEMYLEGKCLMQDNKVDPSYLAEEILMAASESNSALPDDTGNAVLNAFLMEVYQSKDHRATYQFSALSKALENEDFAQFYLELAVREGNLDAMDSHPDAPLLFFVSQFADEESATIKEWVEQTVIQKFAEGSQLAKVLLEKMYA